MFIYDTVLKKKIKIETLKDGEVSIYICGPTVYDSAHLGHARSSLSFDLLNRVLKNLGYKTKVCRNLTDVDDKIILKLKEKKQNLLEFTSFYIDEYKENMKNLNILPIELEPQVTENIKYIENMIIKLIKNNYAYVSKSGNIYFNTSKDKKYGSISNQIVNEEKFETRLKDNLEKKNIKDFSLWKIKNSNDDIFFKSSLGDGRPAWHIECSAIIDRYFEGDKNYSIDIHCGGSDLIFPHHENEASQSRCFSGHELSKYWMHNGFVKIDDEKMSKSLQNSFFLKDALKIYNSEVLRFYLISIHYRSSLNFNNTDLLNSKKQLDKLYRLKKRAFGLKASIPNKIFHKDIISAMSDDLNISKTLSIINDMILINNDLLDKKPTKNIKKEILANIDFINNILGIGDKNPFLYFQIGISEDEKKIITELIEDRNIAKIDKNYSKADDIRAILNKKGVKLMDMGNETLWEKNE